MAWFGPGRTVGTALPPGVVNAIPPTAGSVGCATAGPCWGGSELNAASQVEPEAKPGAVSMATVPHLLRHS